MRKMLLIIIDFCAMHVIILTTQLPLMLHLWIVFSVISTTFSRFLMSNQDFLRYQKPLKLKVIKRGENGL